MSIHALIKTNRLLIEPLTVDDDNFILELVNTEGWIKFIGNRNIYSAAQAGAYIQKVLANKDLFYWVVKLAGDKQKIGIITFIKRDYLEHHDIGFAFLPKYFKNGYAYEASLSVLNKLIIEKKLSYIFATTVPENESSIRLLNKMGLVFEKEIKIAESKLHVFGASVEKIKD